MAPYGNITGMPPYLLIISPQTSVNKSLLISNNSLLPQRKRYSVLLLIDANDHKSTSLLHKLGALTPIDLIDIIVNDRDKPPTVTHFIGNMIDYILLFPDLDHDAMALDILPINHHIISDYRASYCDIEVNTSFSVPCLDDISHIQRMRL